MIRSALEQRVEALIDQFRPYIRADGGDVELVEVRDGIVRVRLRGACVGCPASHVTLQMGLETYLREHVPEVRGVEDAR